MSKGIFIALAALFVLGVMGLASFWHGDSPPVDTFRIRTDNNTVILGITPWGDSKKVKEQYKPLVDFIGKRLGKKVQFLTMEDYDVAVENLVEGNIDISVMAPASYVQALAKEPGLRYITTSLMENNGVTRSTYNGCIVALKEKYDGMTFDDFLKNPKRYKMGFVSRSSASGWAYPAAMMMKRGLDPEKTFKEAVFFDNHHTIIDSLVAGKIDLAATWDGNISELAPRYGDIFQIVYRSPGIPGSAWVASKNFDPALAGQVGKILEEINSSDELKKELLKDAPDKGWTKAPDSFYDSVREVVKYVGAFK